MAYTGREDCILKEGLFAPAIADLPNWLEPGELKQCYQNASNAVIQHDTLRYVEGYALFRNCVPMEHAWVYDMATGQFYDPTWLEGQGSEYYGVVFDTAFILSLMVKTEHYGVWGSECFDILHTHHKEGFPNWAILPFKHEKNNNRIPSKKNSQETAEAP